MSAHMTQTFPEVEDDKKKSSCCSNVWSTNEMMAKTDDKENRRRRARNEIRAFLIYIPYLIVLCILAFSMVSTMEYRYTSALKNVLEDNPIRPDSSDYHEFVDIMTVVDVWDWLETPMLKTLYPTERYNGEKLTEYESQFIVQESKLIGLPRLRMLKVNNGSCDIPIDFRDEIFSCFGPYSTAIEDRNEQFPSSIYSNASDLAYTNETAWKYQSQKELDGLPLLVSNTDSTYGGGGFVQELPAKQSDVVATLAELKAGRWITEGTRVLFLDFTVYNANINMFCVVKYIFEFPAAGGVTSSSQFNAIKLIRYNDPVDYFVMACEIVFLLFVLYYTVEEIKEAKFLGFYKYLTNSVWQVWDCFILLCSYISIFFYAYRTALVGNTLDDLVADETSYANFSHVAYWQIQFNFMVAITLFLSWIKIFKYMSFHKTMYQMSQTLSQCAQDILGYTVMFFIVFFAFAQLGYLVFSSNTFGFHTFADTIFTLFRIILGDFDFYALQQKHPVFGPIYFVTYIFVVFFILVNVFLAIINDSYINVKKQIEDDKKNGGNDHSEVTDMIRETLVSFFSRKKREGRSNAVSPAPVNVEDGATTETQRISVTSGSMGNPAETEMIKLNKRVNRLEEAVGSTLAKIDSILVHLENIEHAQRQAAGYESNDDTDA